MDKTKVTGNASQNNFIIRQACRRDAVFCDERCGTPGALRRHCTPLTARACSTCPRVSCRGILRWDSVQQVGPEAAAFVAVRSRGRRWPSNKSELPRFGASTAACSRGFMYLVYRAAMPVTQNDEKAMLSLIAKPSPPKRAGQTLCQRP